jgi:hypothetical protein
VQPHVPLAWLLILAGNVVQVLGLVALVGAFAAGSRPDGQGRLLDAALALSITGLVLVVPLFGFMAVGAAVAGRLFQAGQPGAMDVTVAFFASAAGMGLLLASALGYVAGSVLFAVFFWRSRLVPRWAAVAYAVQAPLIVLPVPFATELAGAVLYLVVAATLLRRGLQPREAVPLPVRTTVAP